MRQVPKLRIGYQRLNQNITLGKADHHEAIDLYAPSPYHPTASCASPSSSSRSPRPLEGCNQWPSQPGRFRSTMESWISKMKILGMCVMRALADGLGMTETEWEDLRGMMDDSFWVMRVIGWSIVPAGR